MDLQARVNRKEAAGLGRSWLRSWKKFSYLPLILCLFLGHSPAQTTNGLITGTVTDTSGAVVPDAQVTVTNVGTSLTRNTTTNNTGAYILPQMPPGVYKIDVSKTGFASAGREHVALQVNQSLTIDFQLGVGSTAQT
ncbi:MAG: carboxypeptidase-like regulatory domain-containing protein, partial [Alloacidobacterium sp.]